jgi:catechol 2,3-dioxygenase-like lactoylglutathione lyase family enzyme
MPQLRHVAITTHDVEKTAKFSIDVFGMKEMGKINNASTVDLAPASCAFLRGEDIATSLPTPRRPRQRRRVPLVGGRRRPR